MGDRLWANLAAEAERRADAHAETTAVRLAERLRADYPALEVTHRGDTVELRGRGLRERQAAEAGLRWLGR